MAHRARGIQQFQARTRGSKSQSPRLTLATERSSPSLANHVGDPVLQPGRWPGWEYVVPLPNLLSVNWVVPCSTERPPNPRPARGRSALAESCVCSASSVDIHSSFSSVPSLLIFYTHTHTIPHSPVGSGETGSRAPGRGRGSPAYRASISPGPEPHRTHRTKLTRCTGARVV